jgi:hypothetical protein
MSSVRSFETSWPRRALPAPIPATTQGVKSFLRRRFRTSPIGRGCVARASVSCHVAGYASVESTGELWSILPRALERHRIISITPTASHWVTASLTIAPRAAFTKGISPGSLTKSQGFATKAITDGVPVQRSITTTAWPTHHILILRAV